MDKMKDPNENKKLTKEPIPIGWTEAEKKTDRKKADDVAEKPDVDPGIDYMKWSE